MRARYDGAITSLATLLALFAAPNAASAADMPLPIKVPTAYAAPVFNWTGFYVGGNLGAAWTHHDWTDTLGVSFPDGNTNGAFIGGGQIGFNYEFDNFVSGVEADFDWDSNSNSSTGVLIPLLNQTIQVTSNDRWITTLAARFGVAWDRALFYGKGGGGWVGTSGSTITNLTTGQSISGSGSNTATGWLLGGGVEWAFWSNFTVKFEYDYMRVGGRTFALPGGSAFLGNDNFTTGDFAIQTAKVGVNYLFNCCGRF